jgi:hypothetical protein
MRASAPQLERQYRQIDTPRLLGGQDAIAKKAASGSSRFGSLGYPDLEHTGGQIRVAAPIRCGRHLFPQPRELRI